MVAKVCWRYSQTYFVNENFILMEVLFPRVYAIKNSPWFSYNIRQIIAATNDAQDQWRIYALLGLNVLIKGCMCYNLNKMIDSVLKVILVMHGKLYIWSGAKHELVKWSQMQSQMPQ